jgi:Concanavalin A-like lectin/glucanases superfamily
MARNFSSGKYLDCGTGSPLTTAQAEMTVSFWYKTTTGGGIYMHPLSRGESIWEIQRHASGYFSWDLGGAAKQVISSVPTDGAWHHALFTASQTANQVKGYKGGILDQSGTWSATASSSNGLEIGHRRGDGGAYPWIGDLAEVALWSRILTVGEIALMAGGAPASFFPSNLFGYWPILGDDSPEPDLSGNDNHAALVGSPAQTDHPTIVTPESTAQLRIWDGTKWLKIVE